MAILPLIAGPRYARAKLIITAPVAAVWSSPNLTVIQSNWSRLLRTRQIDGLEVLAPFVLNLQTLHPVSWQFARETSKAQPTGRCVEDRLA